MKKIVGLILVVCIFCQTAVFASDGADDFLSEVIASENGVEVAAKSAILMDATTGKILYEKNPHEKLPLASVTKIMTMLLIMEHIEKGELKLDDMVTTSTHASKMGGSQIWLKEGEQMSVHDMMKAVAVASANDAAMALAEQIAGSEEAFVMMMNNKALELGMNDTTFLNPTGLDAEGHLSSAYDIAIMTKELLKKKDITEYTTIWMDSLRGGKTELVNTNKLIRFYKGATGMKTGTTNGAGSCISATAARGDMSLIAVVMGCNTSAERFADAKRLLDYGFSRFVVYHTIISKNEIKPVKVSGGVKQTVPVDTTVSDTIIIPAGKEKKVVEDVTMMSDLTAPIAKGQKIGEIILSIDGKEIAKFDIVAAEEVAKMSFGHALLSLLKRTAEL